MFRKSGPRPVGARSWFPPDPRLPLLLARAMSERSEQDGDRVQFPSRTGAADGSLERDDLPVDLDELVRREPSGDTKTPELPPWPVGANPRGAGGLLEARETVLERSVAGERRKRANDSGRHDQDINGQERELGWAIKLLMIAWSALVTPAANACGCA